MELQELKHLRERQQILHDKGGARTRQEDLEEMANSARETFLLHDVIMGRVVKDRKLRDEVTAELVPRACLRYEALLTQPMPLDSLQRCELAELQEWLTRLHERVMAHE